jgi:chromosome segregation ATPase
VLTDVVVENEILDAAIEANGACVVARGKILSSRISARKGILASEIGSLQTSPCDLIVGVDNRLKKDVSGLKEKISERKAQCQQIEASIQELGQKDEAVEAQLTELSQNEGEILAKKLAIIKKLEDSQMAAETHQVAKAKEALQLMEVKIEQIQDTVTALLEEQEEIQDRQDIYQMQRQHIGDEITGLESEINHLMEMSKKENGHAYIKALDEIFPRTRIKGPHAALTLKDNHKRVSIVETRADVDGHAHRWQMQMASL